jgi:hypothetical protein
MNEQEFEVVDVAKATGAKTLAGIAAGKAALPSLESAVGRGSGLLLLNFERMQLITASAFRESILPVVSACIEGGRPCALVNLNAVAEDEAHIAAERSGTVLLVGRFNGKSLSDVRAQGALDEKVMTALLIVLELQETDAKGVSERSGDHAVTTVWNNRLVALQRMGLLRERKAGKTKLYSPVVKGMSYGS